MSENTLTESRILELGKKHINFIIKIDREEEATNDIDSKIETKKIEIKDLEKKVKQAKADEKKLIADRKEVLKELKAKIKAEKAKAD